MDTLIPFGLHEETEQLVDVASVARGRECDCVCPSCRTPLIARHGDKKEWHFAHDSRRGHQKTIDECKYSMLVSIRLMIRQLANDELTLLLPDYTDHIRKYCEVAKKYRTISFTITESSKVELVSVQVGASFSNVEVDLIGEVKQVPLVLYCTYPGRVIPETLYQPNEKKCGVLEINLGSLAAKFQQVKKGQYISELKYFLEQSVDGKHWIYHPKYAKAKHNAEKEFDNIPIDNKASAYRQSTVHSYQLSQASVKVIKAYKCISCNNEWSGSSYICSNCNTHLFTTER